MMTELFTSTEVKMINKLKYDVLEQIQTVLLATTSSQIGVEVGLAVEFAVWHKITSRVTNLIHNQILEELK